jgi:hypothetical protein
MWISGREDAMVFATIRFVLLAVLFTTTCVQDNQVVRRKNKPASEVLGKQGVAILSAAERVEVFQIDHKPAKARDNTVDGFPVRETGKEMGPGFASRIARVLLDDRTYWLRSAEIKELEPGFAFRIWKGKESVEVLVSGWSYLAIVVKDANGQVTHRTMEHQNVGKDGNFLKLEAFGRESFRKKNLGEGTESVLHQASRTEVFRLTPADDDSPTGRISGYKRVSVGKEQGKEFTARLAQLLLDDKTYSNLFPKSCFPEPGVAFRICCEKTAVEVTLCFECDEFGIGVINPQGVLVYYVWENFDPVRGELVRLAKLAFPDDATIQKLKENPFE